MGRAALYNNTNGNDNVASGYQALVLNTTGSNNLASGTNALFSNMTGNGNLALGNNALEANTASANVAAGRSALTANTTGHDNTAHGFRALLANTTGSGNVALGSGAGKNLTTGSNNVEIANPGQAADSGTIRIGTGSQTATFIAGIRGADFGGTAQPVVINSSGRLGTAPAPASATSLAATVEDLTAELKRQQHQIERLRERVKGG